MNVSNETCTYPLFKWQSIFLGVQKFYELHYFPFRGILGRFLNLIEKESQISLANSYLCIINIDKIYRDIPEL